MSSHTRLLLAMRDVLRESGISEVPAAGEFCLPAVSPVLFPGAVYGFAVKLSHAELLELFNEAVSRKLSRVNAIGDLGSIEEGLYPIYWGKDKQLGARPHQHLQDPVGTGALRLSTYKSLAGKAIACVSLTVSDFNAAERALQNRYPDLLKTTKVKHAA
mgnify:CR=1 FL=1